MLLNAVSLGIPASSPRGLAMKKDMRRATCKRCQKHFFVFQMLPGASFCSSNCLLSLDVPKRKGRRLLFATAVKQTKPRPQHLCARCNHEIPHNCKLKPYCSKRCKRGFVAKKEVKTPIRSIAKKLPVKRIELYSTENKERWQKLRYQALREMGHFCACCGSKQRPFHVDHIKPKSKYPELAWEISNLQILCEDCNMGKSYLFEDDWRPSGLQTPKEPGLLRDQSDEKLSAMLVV